MTNVSLSLPSSCFELRFESLFRPGCALAFPCDSEGHVDDEHLGANIRHSYLFARAMVGREYKWPRITPCTSPAGAGGPAGDRGPGRR